MEIGESRFTFKCIACGATDTIGGAWMGTGSIAQRIREHTDGGCSQCGGPIMLYGEEMRYDWDEYGEKIYLDEYQTAHTAFLKSKASPTATAGNPVSCRDDA